MESERLVLGDSVPKLSDAFIEIKIFQHGLSMTLISTITIYSRCKSEALQPG